MLGRRASISPDLEHDCGERVVRKDVLQRFAVPRDERRQPVGGAVALVRNACGPSATAFGVKG